MSADLFAAFGDTNVAQTSDTLKQSHSQTVKPAVTLTSLDDTWQAWPTAASTPAVNRTIEKKPSPLWQRDQTGNDVLFDANEDFDGDEENDDFGDFEDGEQASAKSPATLKSNQQAQSSIHASNYSDSPSRQREQLQRKKEFDLLGLDDEPPTQQLNHLKVRSDSPQRETLDSFAAIARPTDFNRSTAVATTTAAAAPATFQEVVDDDDDDDEWGTFEDVTAHEANDTTDQNTISQPVVTETNLWDFSAFENAEPTTFTSPVGKGVQPEHEKVQQFQSQSIIKAQLNSAPVQKQSQHSVVKPSGKAFEAYDEEDNNQDEDEDGEEEWDDFDTIKSTDTATTTVHPRTSATATSASKATIAATTANTNTTITSNAQRTRPTNIPPPSVLLSLLPRVFSQLASNTISSTSPTSPTSFSSSSSPATSSLETAQLIVQAYTVSARILSGRGLRWKRDTILSQSMSVSASTAASGGRGMKLTSLDRGESRKEDQEAELAVRAWARHQHGLTQVMSRAKLQKPAISLNAGAGAMKVRTENGALTATHVCPICGLKRNERIVGIDTKVDDTFGEFWIEHWGHSDCSGFWYRYNTLLTQR